MHTYKSSRLLVRWEPGNTSPQLQIKVLHWECSSIENAMLSRVEEEMDFFEKSKSEKLLFCFKVWRNAKKNLGPIGPFWNMRNWQIKKTYLHYMSIFQSCRILVFYSLNESIRGVQEENIIMLGFSSRILVGK